MKDKILQIISQPLVISLVLTFVLIYFLPDFFTKYKIDIVEINRSPRKNTTYFKDLNNDHKSEKIVYCENNLGKVSYEIHNSDGGFVDQWNFSGDHSSDNWRLGFFDINDNGFLEIYHITRQNDSLFLNIDEPFVKNGLKKLKIFLDVLHDADQKIIFATYLLGVYDSNNNGSKELFLNMTRGFQGDPRNVYKYDILTGGIVKSPHLTNPSYVNSIEDLEKDGNMELFISNYSAGNKIDSLITLRSDYSSWITILDNDLQFKFEPIEVPLPFSTTQTLPIKNNSGNFDVLCVINSKNPEKSPCKLVVLTPNGTIIKEKILPPGNHRLFKGNKEGKFILFNQKYGQVQTLDENLNTSNSFFIHPNSLLFPTDINLNGSNEWLAINHDKKNVTVFDENFMFPLEFEVPYTNSSLLPGLKRIGTNKNQLVFSEGNNFFVYDYDENPFYLFRYLINVGIFVMVFGFVWLMRKGMQLKIEKQRAIEDQISELQIKTINNQIDPHFVFNAINTISAMTLLDNKVEADDFICKFSDFMRGSLNHSDKIITSLEDEIGFVENFIQLQKIRYSNRFDYSITIDQDVDLGIKIPKHIIFSYVENAIKHGLSKSKEQGLLQIKASIQDLKLLLIIEDNGPGLVGDELRKDSTGNGLRIMDEMFDLFYKLYKKKIQSKVIELFDQDKNKIGFKVELLISK